jgi:hypothetical protein
VTTRDAESTRRLRFPLRHRCRRPRLSAGGGTTEEEEEEEEEEA